MLFSVMQGLLGFRSENSASVFRSFLNTDDHILALLIVDLHLWKLPLEV